MLLFMKIYFNKMKHVGQKQHLRHALTLWACYKERVKIYNCVKMDSEHEHF